MTESVKPQAVLITRTSVNRAKRSPLKSPSATLRVSVEHKFDQAKLTVSIDNHTVLRRDLMVVEKKTFGPIGRSGNKQSPDVHLTPGQHELRVRVQSPKNGYDESHTMKAIFQEDGNRLLSVRFGKKQEMKISLK